MSDQEENNVAEEEPVSMVEAEAEAEAEAEPEPEAEPAAEEETVVENGDGEMEANCRKAFDLFDLDGSGKISASEFGTVMRSLGQNPTDDDIEELLKVKFFELNIINKHKFNPFQSVDQDMDGSLSFEEFVQLMQKRVESQKDVNEGDLFRDAFKVFDKDGSGKISKSELK